MRILNNNDIKYEYKEGINQWWQGQGCFICYFYGEWPHMAQTLDQTI